LIDERSVPDIGCGLHEFQDISLVRSLRRLPLQPEKKKWRRKRKMRLD